jgi:chloride channel protein, CIC family
VFAPSLFMGAMLGSAYGDVAHHLTSHLAAAAGAYGLVGMGAVFAAAARAPITAVIIIFELTDDYRIILPLMVAIIVATALSNAVTHDTIYTLKLRRRGIDVDTPRKSSVMAQISTAEAMGKLPRPLAPEQPLQDVLDRFAAERADTLPVIDADGALVGVIASADLQRTIAGSSAVASAASLAHEAPELHANQSLEEAVRAMAVTDDEGVPVLSADGHDVVGWLTHRRVLRAYRARLDGR